MPTLRGLRSRSALGPGLALMAGLSALGCTAETEGTRASLSQLDGHAFPGTTPDDAPHPDAGKPVFDPQDDAGTGTSDSECQLAGTYALWAEMDVQWAGTSLANVIPVLDV